MTAEKLLDTIMDHVDNNGELDPGHRTEAIGLITAELAEKDRRIEELEGQLVMFREVAYKWKVERAIARQEG